MCCRDLSGVCSCLLSALSMLTVMYELLKQVGTA